ncbi:hypothetical protein [Yoonia sp. 2307UL14-13]|uniref:hypothetical protein n=1 Tax=Yoonia sp. 2307UL14-13 TaxID=3126506 RepID=UPI0030A3B5DA
MKRIVRRHDRMASGGAVKTVSADGLIVARPRMYKPRFPLKGLVVLVVLGFLFKGFLFAYLGETEYLNRVAELSNGSMMEQVGAWVMHADPATVVIAGSIESLLL